ncbi:MAG: hypothetical protein GY702_18365 [Desulfobulbaceae bacterium]|nr:hypothetical protein [Desulfobulbaceae bacterium]
MKFLAIFSGLILSSFLLYPAIATSNDNAQHPQETPQSPWSTDVRGGAIYQFDADLDEGGSYTSGRYNIEVGQNYGWSRRDTATLAFSYTLESYDFSAGNPDGIAFNSPWENIHTFSTHGALTRLAGNFFRIAG